MTRVMGEGGTGGRTLRLMGRGLFFSLGRDGSSNVDRMAVAGGGGIENDVFHTGADGGGRAVLGPGDTSELSVRGVPTSSSSGEEVFESSARLWWLSVSKPLPIPRSSCSSSSSTRSSLRKLPLVLLLAREPVRLREAYRLLQAGPIPRPEPVEAMEEVEDLRATILSSIALSKALASCMTRLLSRSSASLSEASSIIWRRRPHSSSSSVADEPSESEGIPLSPFNLFSYSNN